MHPKNPPLRVAVLAGGDSPERDVSLVSGAAVCEALQNAGHEVQVFDPAQIPVEQIPWFTFDACFLALHGGAGEDGRVQQQLENLGVDFTGSRAAACRAAMNKSVSKERFFFERIPTAEYCLLHASESPDVCAAKAASLGYPLVVKPNSQGSSLGVTIVRRAEELADALTLARNLDPFTLVETFVDGRELTVAVLDRRPLPALEIVTTRGFFDYEAKYSAHDTREEYPSDMAPKVVAHVEQLAVRAAQALGTRGLVRVDLILDSAGIPWVLEVNTTPGMTGQSLAPKAARLAGFDMSALCQWIVQNALAPVRPAIRRPSLAHAPVPLVRRAEAA